MLLRRHKKTGLQHAQWDKDAAVQKLTQGLAADDLKHAAQHIGGAAVLPVRTWFKHQWQRGKLLGKPRIAALQ